MGSYNRVRYSGRGDMELKEKKFAKAPLLYITQPNVKKPEVEMQSQYVSKRKKKTNEQSKQEVKEKKGVVTYNSDGNVVDFNDRTGSEPQEKRKPFKEMTVEEKVRYFVDAPSYVPKVRCEVKTTSRRYRGEITALEDDHVIVQIGTRTPPKKVPLGEIIDIHIIGF